MKKKQRTVYFNDKDWNRFKDFSKEKGLSISDFILEKVFDNKENSDNISINNIDRIEKKNDKDLYYLRQVLFMNYIDVLNSVSYFFTDNKYKLDGDLIKNILENPNKNLQTKLKEFQKKYEKKGV